MRGCDFPFQALYKYPVINVLIYKCGIGVAPFIDGSILFFKRKVGCFTILHWPCQFQQELGGFLVILQLDQSHGG